MSRTLIYFFGLVVCLTLVLSGCGARKLEIQEIHRPQDLVEALIAGLVESDIAYLNKLATPNSVAYLMNRDNRVKFLISFQDVLGDSPKSIQSTLNEGIIIRLISSGQGSNSALNKYTVTFRNTEGGPSYGLEVTCVNSRSSEESPLRSPCQLKRITEL